MADPCVSAVSTFTTGTGTSTTIAGATFTCDCQSNSIVVIALGIAATSRQTTSSVTYAGSPTQFYTAGDDGTDERLEIWYEVDPPATANAAVVPTLSAAARFNMHVFSICEIYTCIPFVDVACLSFSAKTASMTQDTLELYSLALLAKMNSGTDPADSGSFQHHRAFSETSNASAGLNVQLDTDVLVTQVDVDQEVTSTTASWSWSGDSSARSATALVLGINGVQPAGTAPASHATYAPYGIVALVQRNLTLTDNLLGDASIHGFGVRTHWKEIQTTDGGAIDWTYFDECVTRATAAGKFLNLRINCGTNGAPSWAYSGVEMHTASTPDMPIPWDPVWLARRKTLMTAFGARYNAYSSVFGGPVRGISGSYVNFANDDWDLPTDAADLTEWTSSGYTTTRLTDVACEYLAHVFASFPNVPAIFVPYNGNGSLDASAITAATIVAAYGYNTFGGRFVLMRNNLKSNTPTYSTAVGTVWELMRTYKNLVATQNVWRINKDTSYRQNGGSSTTLGGNPDSANAIMAASVTNAVSFGVKYMEIYSPDLRDSTQRSAWDGQVPTPADALASSRKTRRPRRRRHHEGADD